MSSGVPGQNHDVIVVGGGVNGLVAATLLAQARRRVLLVEAQDRLGGMCRTGEITAGFRVSTIAHLVGPLDAAVTKSLRLSRLGLQFTARQAGMVALSPDGRHIILGEDLRHTAQSLQVHDVADARGWAAYETRMRKAAQQLHGWTQQAAALPAPGDAGKTALFPGRARASLPFDAEMAQQLELSIADLVTSHFRTPLLQAALSFDAILGNSLPPTAGGTALLPVLKRALDPQPAGGLVHPQGGAGALVGALQKAGEAAGLKTRTGARAAAWLFEAGRIAGVQLENGECVYAPYIVSSLSPQVTYLQMGAARDLPLGFKRRLRGVRSAGCVAKVNLALGGLPAFKGLDKRHLKDRLLVCKSLEELERSYAAHEQGRLSSVIALDATLPSTHDASLARAGTHVMSVNATYVPGEVDAPTGDAARADLVALVVTRLREFAPDLPDLVVAAEVLLPSDLAELGGGAGAHWHGADLSLDQLGVLRPALLASGQATPVPGLFLCGAATHPCGGVTGTNGRLAAEAVLAAMAEGG